MARGYRAVLELGEREDALRVADRLFHEWLHDKYSLWVSKPHVTTRASTDSVLFYHREGNTWTSS